MYFPQSLKPASSLLEKLAIRDQLNVLILNLHPEKNEYSFSFRMGSIPDDMGAKHDDCLIKMPWQPNDDLLRCIDNEEIPHILTDLLEENHPELFYSGCLIVKIREFEQINYQVYYESRYVLLKPTNLVSIYLYILPCLFVLYVIPVVSQMSFELNSVYSDKD